MSLQLSGINRTRRLELSPKVREQRELYSRLASGAVFRAYPSIPDFAVEICLLDHGDKLELFWQIVNLGGETPGGWHQVHDLQLHFVHEVDGRRVAHGLTTHCAGFHAWYRMRGGMTPVLPESFYINLDSGAWTVSVSGRLQDAKPLCLFADSFGDLFHYAPIQEAHERLCREFRDRKFAADVPPAPIEPFDVYAGRLVLDSPRRGELHDLQANRLSAAAVRYADVRDVPVPPVVPPSATPLDPVRYFGRQLRYLHEQSLTLNYCPYDTVNHWDHPPELSRTHFVVNQRTAYFHIEALAPLYRVTGDAEVYRTARKWYETMARNIWPAPGGGSILCCGDRTVWGSALTLGGSCDAVATFAEIDGQPRWGEPFRAGLLAWPMHPRIPRPLMDQDAWGYEEMNTTGTYNMVTHFAVALWRIGYLTQDAALMARAEHILYEYTFRGEENGVWPYRPGNFPSHHYDMYLKWQLSRLLATGAPRWTRDKAFLALMKRGMDATLSKYASESNGELVFWDWTHDPKVTHPANSARQALAQIEVLAAMTVHVDAGYLDPLSKGLRACYRLLSRPEVDACWRSAWFHVHGNLLSLALHGFHVEGDRVEEMKVVRG